MTRDEIMACEAAIDAMAAAADRYRTGAGLPGASTDVPGWVSELDANKVALTVMVAAAQDEILNRAPQGDSRCAD